MKADASAGTVNAAVREAWLEKILAAIPSGHRILDAGAGERQFERFCSHLEYVAQDFAQYDGKGDGAGLQTGSWDQSRLDIVSDITAIPEPDRSFDAIMCVEVFEHIPDPLAAIDEFSRLLKPGGRLIITSPFCSLTHFAPYHFYSGFNRYFYERCLGERGFEQITVEANGNFFEFLAQELRRAPSMAAKFSSPWRRVNGRVVRLASAVLLRALTAASREDRGSAATLCFGFHVTARKTG